MQNVLAYVYMHCIESFGKSTHILSYPVHPSILKDLPTNSFRMSNIDLKFGGVMHSTQKQVATVNDYARLIFVRSMELRKFLW